MFNNIGGKIKILAKILTYVGIIFSLIIGFYYCFMRIILNAVLWIILGSLLSWISSFTLYGFGQLIENSEKIVDNMKDKNKLSSIKKESEKKLVNISEEEFYNFAKKQVEKLSKVDYAILTKNYKIWNDQIKNYSISTLCNILQKEQNDWEKEYIQLCCFELINKYEANK